MEQVKESIISKEDVYVKNLRINQKKRIKTVLVFLVVFNMFLICSMIYFCAALRYLSVTIICGVFYCLFLWRSTVTFLKAKTGVSVELFMDKIVVRNYRGETIVNLKDVYDVKIRKSLFQLMLKKPANTIVLTIRKEEGVSRVMISFIENNIQKLSDKISLFAIRERNRKNSENN